MYFRSKRFRWHFLITIVLIVIVPYTSSRIASCWRQVSIHSNNNFPADEIDKSTVRIACYNIAHGRGLASSNWEGGTAEERKARLSDIAELLKSLDADIVVLNEVDFDSSWSLSTNQVRFLATQADYSYWSEQRNLDFRVLIWKWRFGNAILSKYPIVEASFVDLPAFSALETFFVGKKRGLNCIVDINGEKVQIVAVHFEHRSEAVRAQSAKVIAEIASSSKVPTIAAGDFNSTPTGFPASSSDATFGNAMDVLDESGLFQRLPELPSGSLEELTFHAARPKSIIDWILVARNFQIIEYRVEPSILSDHRPVVAEIVLGQVNGSVFD